MRIAPPAVNHRSVAASIILLSSQTETWHPSPYIEKVVRFIGINIHTHNKGASLIDGRIPEIFEARVHF